MKFSVIVLPEPNFLTKGLLRSDGYQFFYVFLFTCNLPIQASILIILVNIRTITRNTLLYMRAVNHS